MFGRKSEGKVCFPFHVYRITDTQLGEPSLGSAFIDKKNVV